MTDKDGVLVAKIKKSAGKVKKRHNKEDSFSITFSQNLHVHLKALLIGACFLIVSMPVVAYVTRIHKKQYGREISPISKNASLIVPSQSYTYFETLTLNLRLPNIHLQYMSVVTFESQCFIFNIIKNYT